MEVAFTSMGGKFDAHVDRDLELSKLREMTCPQDERMGRIEQSHRELASDVNAVAGVVREHQKEHKQTAQNTADAKKFWTRSTAGEAMKIAAAVLVALITTKLLGL